MPKKVIFQNKSNAESIEAVGYIKSSYLNLMYAACLDGQLSVWDLSTFRLRFSLKLSVKT